MTKRPYEPGTPMPVANADGRGPLSFALWNLTVGAVDIYGGPGPDLFAMPNTSSQPTAISPPEGLYLFRRLDTTPDGVPVFGDRKVLDNPFGGSGQQIVAEGPGGKVHLLRMHDGALEAAPVTRDPLGFDGDSVVRVILAELPERSRFVGAHFTSDDVLEVYLAVSDGNSRPVPGTNRRSQDYVPYNGAGIWNGGIPRDGLWVVPDVNLTAGSHGTPRRVSPTDHEVALGFGAAAHVDFGAFGSGVIGGASLGNLQYYPDGPEETRRYAVSGNGRIMRHTCMLTRPVAYPNAEGLWCDLIVGGEGAVQYYRFTGEVNGDGNPIYADAVWVPEQDAALYAGSLCVLSAADWDGDGVLDIIAGNSEGRVLFMRNAGTNDAPEFMNGEPIRADGKEIHVQAGYGGSIQGPEEARWGYACPRAVDWNGDGMPDLVMSDVTAVHTAYLNIGTRTEPKLDAPIVLQAEGLPLHGTWRVQPAVAPTEDPAGVTRLAYVALDEDDDFHLWRQVDVENVEDFGKLRLTDGSKIGANYTFAGGTGRLKLILADWDRDGRTDLLVATPRNAAIPDPENGLPKAVGLPGASVLLLRNVGTDAEPRFEFPKLMHYDGEPVYLGHHACSAVVWDYGQPGGADMITGDEWGRIRFFPRAGITFE